EWAVSGAASVATHMLERGFAVRLLTDTGSSVPGPEGGGGFSGDSSDMAGLLLDTLAVVEHSDAEDLAAAYEVLRTGTEGLLVAFLGDIYEEQATILGRMRQRAGGAVAFVLDSDDWLTREAAGRFDVPEAALTDPADPDTTEHAVQMLREAGWTVVAVGPGQPLAELWRQADRYRSGEESAGERREAGARP
ncbi:MAG: DUF58 domain-containing protein, partial [Actinomycetia bacterium]|nr:DUF58 domain-containing protein [Actinomycetes bacterium]